MANRYFIELSYDGSEFHGWQIQPNAKTIQESLNSALSTLLRTEIYTVGCGRTDTGVHATQFFAHFDTDLRDVDLKKLTFRCNRFLPESIAVHRMFAVPSDAHTRFSATSRSYAYLITQKKDPFAVLRKWEMRESLDLERMNLGAEALTSYEDFSCFSKSNTQTETNLCDLTFARWTQNGSELRFEVTANRFLRNMVRAMVGTLIDLGRGTIDIETLQAILASKDRSKAGFSAPAHGLYLTRVTYPDDIIS
ncbi:MAG: tRNA pseudouridine(38-40) synthase TruA [Cryomorphaceae bacterium]